MDGGRDASVCRVSGIFLLRLRKAESSARSSRGWCSRINRHWRKSRETSKCSWEVLMSGSVKAEVGTHRNYVNGQRMASASGETFPVYDPSTEEVIARVSASD